MGMGTRGMIEVYDPRNKLLARIYVHSDMYPDNGTMCEVAKFLEKRYLVNGITDYFRDVNTMDNLAALIVAHLINWGTKEIRRLRNMKRSDLIAGFVYLYPFDLDVNDTDIEYLYQLYPTMDEEALSKVYEDFWRNMGALSLKKPKVLDVVKITAKKLDEKGLTDFFDGTLRDFAKQYCKL
jgi:hypothetical protein